MERCSCGSRRRSWRFQLEGGSIPTIFSRFFQACVTHEAAQVIYLAMEATDVTPLLPRIQVLALDDEYLDDVDTPEQLAGLGWLN